MAAEGAPSGGSARKFVHAVAAPDLEVRAVAKRRQFGAAYRLAVLSDAEMAPKI